MGQARLPGPIARRRRRRGGSEARQVPVGLRRREAEAEAVLLREGEDQG